jgi:hypothetical protein
VLWERGIKRDVRAYFLVIGSKETIVQLHERRMSSPGSDTGSPSFFTCSDISMLDRPTCVTCPLSSKSHTLSMRFVSDMRSNAPVTVVTCSPVCLYATTPERASRSMNRAPSLVK